MAWLVVIVECELDIECELIMEWLCGAAVAIAAARTIVNTCMLSPRYKGVLPMYAREANADDYLFAGCCGQGALPERMSATATFGYPTVS